MASFSMAHSRVSFAMIFWNYCVASGSRPRSNAAGVFPVSDSAQEVADALGEWMVSCGASVRLNSRARRIDVEDGRVVGVTLYGGE